MDVGLLLTLQLFLFALALWLGSYLLALPSEKWTLRLTGWGLIAFAAALGARFFSDLDMPGLWLLPAILWIGAVLHLWPPETPWRPLAVRIWVLSAVPLWILALLEPWIGVIPLLSLLVLAGASLREMPDSHVQRGWVVIAVVTLFLTLSTGLIVLPNEWVASVWGVALLGVDLILLGLAATWWDAFEQGHRVRRPLLRSFVASFYFAGALAALVLIGSVFDGEFTLGLRFLLVSLIAIGVLSQVFGDHIQTLLDRLTFSGSSRLTDERRLLRRAADNLPRQGSLDQQRIDREEFTRMTRQALSDLGDLSKLAASPLTELDVVARQSENNPLDRAHRLREVLTDSIERLKPRTGEDFGVTDEWRYYNALYFPYVVGLKPYARQPHGDPRTEAAGEALEWFQTSVPERTLYNWQATAAELVAQDLLSQQLEGRDWH